MMHSRPVWAILSQNKNKQNEITLLNYHRDANQKKKKHRQFNYHPPKWKKKSVDGNVELQLLYVADGSVN